MTSKLLFGIVNGCIGLMVVDFDIGGEVFWGWVVGCGLGVDIMIDD